MSLQDQLLKSGLTSKQQHQNARTAKRKQRKNQSKAPSQDAQQDAQGLDEASVARQRVEQARADKANKDRALNLKREEQRQQRERMARIRQLIEQHQLSTEDLAGAPVRDASSDTESADTLYRFTLDNNVRQVTVSPQTRSQLVTGLLAITRKDLTSSDFAVIPRALALDIKQQQPGLIVVMHDGNAESENEPDDAQDPYAGYDIPDDLMW